jgi:hypothetical protein
MLFEAQRNALMNRKLFRLSNPPELINLVLFKKRELLHKVNEAQGINSVLFQGRT